MKTKIDYLIKLTYDKDYKGYVADVVNLYGCMSQGKTKKEALKNAGKAITAYMESLAKEERGEIVKTSPIRSAIVASSNPPRYIGDVHE